MYACKNNLINLIKKNKKKHAPASPNLAVCACLCTKKWKKIGLYFFKGLKGIEI